ncbi:hypothetical protein P152DRAFT_472535 [Eremomyces bilateralis CBS 781.70]|uniref:ATP synthase F(0) complex subunit e, mitochondrial n=1 Tax=Eremomyces bilateralis CBS 781.70 TaxID=1392243 RepID=A0A6G1G6N6_9PEZI|nr:uncharacterized protein P152DRAFT_472535 [Eremomyces bilateralis CBS 781.70]KAF1813713.1 hypothetical protein P152DRAFT_472535 [Eremomyces bilateralis CBS 781.70]
MASEAVNVLRWLAGGLGVFYGFTHQRSLSAQDRAAALQREYQKKEQLISQAKQEYAVHTGKAPRNNKPKMDEIEAYLTGQLE